MKRWLDWLQTALFPVETDHWLAFLRVGLGVQVVFYALSLENDWNYLFAGIGHELIGPKLAEALLSTESPFVPRLGWLIALGARVGLGEWIVLSIAWWILLVSGIGLIAGILSRPLAILAWFVHLCAAKSGGSVSYGVDNFMTIGLFYLMLSPLPDRYSLDRLWRQHRRTENQHLPGRHLLGFWRRVLQIHLCLTYFFGGLTKALGSGWWDGSNLWRALIRPPFNMIAPEILVKWKYLFPVTGACICILEIGYPFFIWQRRTRAIWLACICGMHVAIGLTMGMYLFASVMIILNVAAFGPGLVWALPRTSNLTTLHQNG
jgi:Vitamin K-dependent gamma-carboxylase